MYKTNKFGAAATKMKALYYEKKTIASIKNRIKKMLQLEDEESESK